MNCLQNDFSRQTSQNSTRRKSRIERKRAYLLNLLKWCAIFVRGSSFDKSGSHNIMLINNGKQR